MVWGGSLGLAPVDDKIIKVEKIANIDSISQLLASILSKKISVGSKYVLIDIPYGPSAKVNINQAKKLKEKFLELGKIFNLKLEVLLTDGSEPIGNGVGPALEMLDVKRVLGKNPNAPKDLENKSVLLAGKLLEMAKKAKRGKGIEMAQKILDSGVALEKFRQIIEAQCGSLDTISLGKYKHEIFSEKSGKIKHQDNKLINDLARTAGCPEDKFAGIYLHKKAKDSVKKGELILTLYAQSKEKLKNAINFYNQNKKNMIIYYNNS
jgi:thymidine phosphorylase